ncbi:MAG: hypothetical protein L6R41_003904 [Letrouitia leprolyta]|nr:MAG: hypothetical protein L6R41_003904 [Letrouitia leprolyta]
MTGMNPAMMQQMQQMQAVQQQIRRGGGVEGPIIAPIPSNTSPEGSGGRRGMPEYNAQDQFAFEQQKHEQQRATPSYRVYLYLAPRSICQHNLYFNHWPALIVRRSDRFVPTASRAIITPTPLPFSYSIFLDDGTPAAPVYTVPAHDSSNAVRLGKYRRASRGANPSPERHGQDLRAVRVYRQLLPRMVVLFQH